MFQNTANYHKKSKHTPKSTRTHSENIRKTHFTFGNSVEASTSPYANYFMEKDLNGSISKAIGAKVKIYSKKEPRPKSNIRFNDPETKSKLSISIKFYMYYNIDPFTSSYQIHHQNVLNPNELAKADANIEKSKKRMQQSQVFKGKALDAISNHNSKLETSYKVAVSKGKIQVVSKDRGNNYIEYKNLF